MGLTGVANIPLMTLVACIFPIFVGMILGNLDNKIRDFLKPGMLISIFLFSFPLGAGMNFKTLITAGIPGLLLGVLTVLWTGIPSYFVYKLLIKKEHRRSCAVGAAVGTSAGNSVATPAAIAAVDATWEPYAAAATAQCAASVVVTALLTPFVVNWLYKYEEKKGLINYDLPLASEDASENAVY